MRRNSALALIGALLLALTTTIALLVAGCGGCSGNQFTGNVWDDTNAPVVP